MKKILSILGLSVGICVASPLSDMIERQAGSKVSVVKEVNLSQDSNLKIVIVKDSQSGMKIPMIANKSESIVIGISSALFTSNQKDNETIINEVMSAQNYNATYKTQAEVKKAINKIPQKYIITLKGKSNKKLYYIVSDPMCPHCQVELNNINKKLENGDVKMIIVGMLGDASLKKAAEIYSNINNAKSDAEKISLLKKVYGKTYEPTSQAADVTKAVQELTRELIGKGKVEGTPYIIEEDR